MRKTLFKYVTKEMFLYFSICFLFFFLIFFVNQILLIAEDILSKKAPLKQVILLIVYSLPMIIATAAPFASLVGILMATSRMTSDKEILSMNALGISSFDIIKPVILVGIFISFFSFITNDILLPVGTVKYHTLYRTILTSTPSLELHSNSIKRIDDSIIVTGHVSDNAIENIIIIDKEADTSNRITSALDITIIPSTNSSILLTLDMNNPKIIDFDKSDANKLDLISAKALSYSIFLKNFYNKNTSIISPREMSSRDLYSTLKTKNMNSYTKNLYEMEFHKKFSIPFGALFFTFLAFPLGLFVSVNGQGVGFILGLIISVFYWAMLIGGQYLSINLSLNGQLMMWAPNIIIFIFGLVFIIKRIVS